MTGADMAMKVISRILTTGILLGVAICGVTCAGAQKKLMLPPMNASVDPGVYPSSALKNSVQGRVLVEFSISPKNKIEDVTIADSDPQGMFDSAARKTLGAVKFTVPDDWEQSGAVSHRFSLSIVFRISPCPTTPCVEPQPHDTADDFLIITAAAKR